VTIATNNAQPPSRRRKTWNWFEAGHKRKKKYSIDRANDTASGATAAEISLRKFKNVSQIDNANLLAKTLHSNEITDEVINQGPETCGKNQACIGDTAIQLERPYSDNQQNKTESVESTLDDNRNNLIVLASSKQKKKQMLDIDDGQLVETETPCVGIDNEAYEE